MTLKFLFETVLSQLLPNRESYLFNKLLCMLL